MTVSSDISKITYQAGGGAPPYEVPFLYLATTDVEAVHRAADGVETEWLEGTQYTLTPAGDASGGQLTVMTSPIDYTLEAGESLTIRRNVAITQEADYQEAGRFPAETHEQALDKLTMIAQQIAEKAGRTLTVPRTDQAGDMELPIDDERASRFLAFDGNGLPVAAAGTSANLGPVSAFIDTLLDDGTAAAARTTLGLGGVSIDDENIAFDIFSVSNAPASFSWDGNGPLAGGLYDLSYLNGIWIAYNLYWDPNENTLSRFESGKNGTALAVHLATDHFPFETFKAISFVRVQGTAAMTGIGNNPPVGKPDRLIWPAAGAVGGYEMLQQWSDQASSAMGGKGVEYDGDGTLPFARAMHSKIGGKHYSGFVVNAFIDFSGTDEANKPSYFTGFCWDEDGTGAREWVQLWENRQNDVPDGVQGGNAVNWVTKASWPVDTGPLSAEIVLDPYAGDTTLGPLPHGLGGMPTGVQAFLECKVAQHVWSVGDRLPFPLGGTPTASGSNHMSMIGLDATNYELVTYETSSPYILNRTSRTQAIITPASWKLVVVLQRLR